MGTPTDILYVIPRPEIGGAERQLLMLMQGLNLDRFRPHVICLDGSGSLLSDYSETARQVHVLDRRRPFEAGTLGALVRLMRDIRPAVVHTWLYIANLYGSAAARAAITDLKAPRVAKNMPGPRSIMTTTGRSRSSW